MKIFYKAKKNKNNKKIKKNNNPKETLYNLFKLRIQNHMVLIKSHINVVKKQMEY